MDMDRRQQIVIDWGKRAFGEEHMDDKIARAARFLEEATEFVQAIGLPEDHAQRVLSYVYSRPPGEPAQEAGGAVNTLMAACGTVGLSLDACQRDEIDRCLSKDPEMFAERNRHKEKVIDRK